ncbi:MAG: DegT/DnrJ/EryC1/StrS family aminotransferase [Xanthomonadaceae bacterium]|nr:DegT/DnrJ/EryC1/StrS family aminotransferase [Xanthomonadaceae bacterium]
MSDPIPLARPSLGRDESDALAAVIESRRLSRGSQLAAFEAAMADLTGAAGAVGVNSGTAGLQFALQALGIGPGDEVITVSFTFVGTVNAIVHTGAGVVLVDIDPATSNVDPRALADAITPRTRAVVVVHLFGRPAPMDTILALARRHGLAVIEDACEAAGSRYQGRAVGGLADAGVFGFYANKSVATGEGGMIVAHDERVLTRCRQLRNQGNDTVTDTRDESAAGFSARLSELHAALGNVQLARLDRSLALREDVAAAYASRLAGTRGVELPAPAAPGDRIAWFTYPVRLPDAASRDRVFATLRARGIECGRYFDPVHRLPFHLGRHRCLPLPITDDIGARSLGLPLFPEMTPQQIERVCVDMAQALEA